MKINFIKKSIRVLFSSPLFQSKDFSRISFNFFKKILLGGIILFVIIILWFCFEIYVPVNPDSREIVVYTVEKGEGDEEISRDLKKLGLIRNSYFFRLYTLLSLKHQLLKVGKYELSPSMSTYKIVQKLARGDILKEKITILEGWDDKEIASYLEQKGICDRDYFLSLLNKDYSNQFQFLKDKPEDVNLLGFLFPDTYEISGTESCEDILVKMLSNFDKKLTKEMRDDIFNQGKTIFDIVIMASILEKEVKTLEDRKIASGILWKRLEVSMPLQVDSTINFITGKKKWAASFEDIKIDSPYNTYLYKGLPKGPISNPGLESIVAAIYPTFTNYWYYLTPPNGRAIFSENFEQHKAAKIKYLGK